MIRFVPGGPFTAEKAVTPEILRNLEAHYGLDQPLWQYLDYLGSLPRRPRPVVQVPNRTVNEIIADKLSRLPRTRRLVARWSRCWSACRSASSPPSGATPGSTTSPVPPSA
jgi:ABC-type dipeptide/oligopeptide/nickel transport system permease component